MWFSVDFRLPVRNTFLTFTFYSNWGAHCAMAATAVSQVLTVAIANIWAGTSNELHCFTKINLTSDTLKKTTVAALSLV